MIEEFTSPVTGITASPGERNPVPSTLNKHHRRLTRPVLHIRSRPTLGHLNESNEKRCVWCLDQQNIVVRTEKLVRGVCLGGKAGTPSRVLGSREGTPTSSYASAGVRHSSTPCTPKRTQRELTKLLGNRKSSSKPLPLWLLPTTSPSTPREAHPDEHVTNGRSRAMMYNSPPPSIRSNGNAFDQTSRRAATPEISSRLTARAVCEEHFTFDFIHGEDATQQEVFEESVLDFVDMALIAQNVSIVCYGPTGSGKTYSVIGGTPELPSSLSAKQQVRARKATLSPAFTRRVKPRVAAPPATRAGSRMARTGAVGPGRTAASTSVRCALKRGAVRARGIECPTEGTASERLSSSSQAELSSSANGECAPQRCPPVTMPSNTRSSTKPRDVVEEGSGKGLGCSLSLGLLPRFVLVLLERRGSMVRLDDETDFSPKLNAVPRSPAISTAGTRERITDSRREHGLLLTLKDITFYGVELYMDELRDLLHPTRRNIPISGDIGGLDAFCQKLNEPGLTAGLKGGSGASDGVGKSDATSRIGGGVPITSVEDFHRFYALAAQNRVTKGHQRNDISSRSHAIFILQLRFELVDAPDEISPSAAYLGTSGPNGTKCSDVGGIRGAGPSTTTCSNSLFSYVAVVDLAGSECVKQSNVEGIELREAQYINKSLSAFSAVLLALYQQSNHVPYRDSKLTRLLKPCLEYGKVLVLAHVSPCGKKEALGSLRFAEQLRHASVKIHNFLNASNELLAAFEDLNNPDMEERFAQYRKAAEEHALLCKEIRLAHFSKDSEKIRELLPGKPSLHSTNRITGDSPFESVWNFKMGVPSTQKRNDVREYVISNLTKRQLRCHYDAVESYLHHAQEDIKREQDEYISFATQRKKKDIEEMRLIVERMRFCNAQLAEENSQPVLRDAHAMEIKQRLKDMATEVTKCAGEKLLLLEGIRVIRQRATIQKDLEQCLDEQLRAPPEGSVVSGTSLQSMTDSNFDEDMESIYNMQQLLSKEMSHLRNESTCFVRCDEIWEGLWARAMRQQILLTVALELEMMEGILLRPDSIHWAIQSVGACGRGIMSATSPAEVDDDVAEKATVDFGSFGEGQATDGKQLLTVLKKALRQTANSCSSVTGGLQRCDGLDHATDNISCDRSQINGESPPAPVVPIPLTLSNGEVVKSAYTLTGSYSDESKLQEAAVEKLLRDGVFCELSHLPFGFDMRELFATQREVSMHTQREKSSVPFGHWGVLRLVRLGKDASSYCLEFSQRTYTTGSKGHDRRVMSIPLDEPQLCITMHVIESDSPAATEEPHDEGSAALTFPLIVLELKGVPVPATRSHQEAHQLRQQHVREEWSSYLGDSARFANGRQLGPQCSGVTLLNSGLDTVSSQGAVLSRRLDCDGELVLPAAAMSSCERGNGIFLIQFSEPVVSTQNRTESIECVVAALAGLTLPSFVIPAASAAHACWKGQTISSDVRPIEVGSDAVGAYRDVYVVSYNHMPHILLNAYGGPLSNGGIPLKDTTKPSTVSMGLSASPLVYASTLGIYFYFMKDHEFTSSLNSSVITVAAAINGVTTGLDPINNRRTPRGRPTGVFATALNGLFRVASLAAPRGNGGGYGDDAGVDIDSSALGLGPAAGYGGEDELTATLLSRIQSLQLFRRKACARLRQQIFDAEDIKAELLYSYSEMEFMRGSHIKDIVTECRDVIGLPRQHCDGMEGPLRITIQVDPMLCRELCGTSVPWTIWQWAHRWQALQEACQQQQQQQMGFLGAGAASHYDGENDSNNPSLVEAGAVTSNSLKRTEGWSELSIDFEDLPLFLSGMS